MIGAITVEPEEAAAKPQLKFLVLAGEEIDELGSARFDSAAGVLVLGHDHVAKNDESSILHRGKIFRHVIHCRRRWSFIADHMVDVFGVFGGHDLRDRSSSWALSA